MTGNQVVNAACVTLMRNRLLHKERQLEVLLVKRLYPPRAGTWALPGGRFEPNKDTTLGDTAVREMFEETGITVKVTPLPYTTHLAGDGRFLLHHYFATSSTKSTRWHSPSPSDDAEAVRWVELVPIVDRTWSEPFVEDLPNVLMECLQCLTRKEFVVEE